MAGITGRFGILYSGELGTDRASPRIRAFEVNFKNFWRGEWDAYRTFWLLNPETTLLNTATV
jgi:hypothetical protein